MKAKPFGSLIGVLGQLFMFPPPWRMPTLNFDGMQPYSDQVSQSWLGLPTKPPAALEPQERPPGGGDMVKYITAEGVPLVAATTPDANQTAPREKGSGAPKGGSQNRRQARALAKAQKARVPKTTVMLP